MERHLRNSGFTNIEIHATGGWHLAMAQMIGLWVKRSPISKKALLAFKGRFKDNEEIN